MKFLNLFIWVLSSNILRICHSLVCDEKSEFLCRSFDQKTGSCEKFGQKCSNDVSVWKNYPLSNLTFEVEPTSSDLFSVTIRTVLSNLTQVRFELKNFYNSTFFDSILDAGLLLTTVDDSTGKLCY